MLTSGQREINQHLQEIALNTKQKDSSDPRPTVLRAELHLPKLVEDALTTREARGWKVAGVITSGLTALFTGLAFAAAAYYAHVARQQRDTMTDTFGQVQQQTTMMRQSLIGTQAALLNLAITFNDGSGNLNVQINPVPNRVSATDVHLTLTASKVAWRDGSIIGSPLHWDPTVPPTSGTNGWNQDYPTPWRLNEVERNQGDTWPQGWPGQFTYVFDAKMTYKNGFGDTVPVEACRQWVPGFTIHFPANRTFAGGGMNLLQCDAAKNYITATQEQYRQSQAQQASQ